MSKSAMNLQDSFLNQVRRENSEVRVLLVNGTLLRGVVRGFDNFTLILSNRNGQHLIYKHAIAQIVNHRSPVKPDEQQPDAAPAAEDEPNTTGAEGEGEAASEETASVAAPAPAARKPHKRRDGAHRERSAGGNKTDQQKPKKEGFNTLDLSGVKLGQK